MLPYLKQLGECRDTSEILELTLAEAVRGDLGVKTIRYYRLRRVKGVEHLVSVDCAGESDYVTAQIRLGRVTKTRRDPHQPRTDGSFDVLGEKRWRPVVFQLNPGLPVGKIETVQEAPLPFYELHGDDCDRILGAGDRRDAWAEVPLRMAGRTLGKLACSLEVGRLDTAKRRLPDGLAAKLAKFHELANFAAPFLESLRALEVNSPLEEASREIFSCQTYEELYKYCTDRLIHLYPFEYESADILVVTYDTLKIDAYPEDEDDSELLVLRGSSFSQAETEGWVNQRFYRKLIKRERPWITDAMPGEDGRGLTPWAWRNRKSLRLNDQRSDPEFKRQLRAYDKDEDELTWVEAIKAGDKIQSLLIVPIPAPLEFPTRLSDDGERDGRGLSPVEGGASGPTKDAEKRRIIGVIRFANKLGGHIEPREEVLLQRLAERCLGPKLFSLRHEVFARNVHRSLGELSLLRLAATNASDHRLAPEGTRGMQANDAHDLRFALRHTLETFLGDMKGKTALLSLCQPNQTVRVFHVAGQLASLDQLDLEYPLNGLAGYLTRRDAPAKKFVFLNDLAYAERKGHYVPRVRGARCALASAIRFGEQTFGAVVLLSQAYDILPGSYGRLLDVIAGQIGVLLARRTTLEFASCVQDLPHDGQHFIHPVLSLVTGATDEGRPLADEEIRRLRRKLGLLSDVLHTHCLTGPPVVNKFRKDCRPTNVRAVIDVAAREAWEAKHPYLEHGDLPEGTLKVGFDRLDVRVNRAYLTICLFNLLKNAWEADNAAEVSASTEGGWLTVCVANRCPNLDAARLERIREAVGGLPPSLLAVVGDARTEGIGLRLVRRLATWHRLPGLSGTPDRPGSLEFVEPLGGDVLRFVLKLPALSEGD